MPTALVGSLSKDLEKEQELTSSEKNKLQFIGGDIAKEGAKNVLSGVFFSSAQKALLKVGEAGVIFL